MKRETVDVVMPRKIRAPTGDFSTYRTVLYLTGTNVHHLRDLPHLVKVIPLARP
jgi:hypothetical protein